MYRDCEEIEREREREGKQQILLLRTSPHPLWVDVLWGWALQGARSRVPGEEKSLEFII